MNSGWEAGANAMMAAKSNTAGGALAGAITVSDDVYMYQITQKGLMVGVSITGASITGMRNSIKRQSWCLMQSTDSRLSAGARDLIMSYDEIPMRLSKIGW